MLELVKFEVSGICRLNELEVKSAKEEVQKTIKLINDRVENGADPLRDSLVRNFEYKLHGMNLMLAIAGVIVKVDDSTIVTR